MRTVFCPYCQGCAEFIGGDVIYPHRQDLQEKRFWRCGRCDAYVGCVAGTDEPLGRLANAELRVWKVKAHAAFDPIWQARLVRRQKESANYTKQMARGGRYKALAELLGIPRDQCHIGMFDVDRCRRAVEICSSGKLEA